MASNVDLLKKAGKIFTDVIDDIGNIKIGESQLRSNKAINPIAKFIFGSDANVGMRGFMKNLGEGEAIKEAAKKAYTNGNKINYGAIAGTYVGVTTAGRILSGGGIYRDSSGNQNLIGVPFI